MASLPCQLRFEKSEQKDLFFWQKRKTKQNRRKKIPHLLLKISIRPSTLELRPYDCVNVVLARHPVIIITYFP